MRHPLSKFSSISSQAVTTLGTLGIEDTDQLLARTATPAERSQLAGETGLAEHDLTLWAGMADLVRINGLDPYAAEALVLHGGVGNVQQFIGKMNITSGNEVEESTAWELVRNFIKRIFRHSSQPQGVHPEQTPAFVRIANRPEVLHAAEALCNGMRAKTAFKESRRNCMTRLAEAAEEAFELRPRLVLDQVVTETSIKDLSSDASTKDDKMSRRTFGIMTAILAFCVIAFMAFEIFVFLSSISAEAQNGDWYIQLIAGVRERGFLYYFLELLLLLGMFLLLLLGFGASRKPLSSLNDRFTLWLFRSPASQAFYRKLLQAREAERKQVSRAGVLLAGVAFLSISLYFALALHADPNASIQDLLEKASAIVATFSFIAGLAVSLGRVSFFVTKMRINWGRDRDGFLRYISSLLADMFNIIAQFLIVVVFIVPLIFQMIAALSQRAIIPAYTKAALATCTAGVHQGHYSSDFGWEYQYSDQDLIDSCMVEAQDNAVLLTLDTSFYPQVIEWVMNYILVWAILGVCSLLVFIPYLAISGWWRGLFYILLIVVAREMEGWIEPLLHEVLHLQPRLAGTTAITWFLLLMTALIIDWLYGSRTERKRICPACSQLVGEEDCYCPTCGLVQP